MAVKFSFLINYLDKLKNLQDGPLQLEDTLKNQLFDLADFKTGQRAAQRAVDNQQSRVELFNVVRYYGDSIPKIRDLAFSKFIEDEHIPMY